MSAQADIVQEARSNLRRILVSMVVIGFAAAAAASTFATFSAQTTNPATIANATVTMTNVVGTNLGGIDCTTGVSDTTCKALFTANNTDSAAVLGAGQTNLKPGDATPATNSVVITYTGSLPTTKFRLFASSYQAKGGASSALCTAVASGAGSPGTQLQFQVKQGGTIIYPTLGSGFGTLDEFGTTYTSVNASLALKGGTSGSGSADVWNTSNSSTFTVNVKLASVDNTYQGCQSTATFAWYAEQ